MGAVDLCPPALYARTSSMKCLGVLDQVALVLLGDFPPALLTGSQPGGIGMFFSVARSFSQTQRCPRIRKTKDISPSMQVLAVKRGCS